MTSSLENFVKARWYNNEFCRLELASLDQTYSEVGLEAERRGRDGSPSHGSFDVDDEFSALRALA